MNLSFEECCSKISYNKWLGSYFNRYNEVKEVVVTKNKPEETINIKKGDYNFGEEDCENESETKHNYKDCEE